MKFTKISLTLIITFTLLTACVSRISIGPVKHTGALFGSFLNRVQDDKDDGVWYTEGAATYGHRNMEFYADADAEWIVFDLKGASDNLRAMVGDGAGIKAIDTALCGFIPTSCLNGMFKGDDVQRMGAIEEVLGSDDRDAFIETVADETRDDEEGPPE